MKANTKNIPALRFPEFFDEWEEIRLGDITTKIGSGSTPKGGEQVYQKSGIPFIRSQNVTSNGLSLADVTYISNEINTSMKNTIVKPNDVLLNITGASLGRSCKVPLNFETGNVNQHVCIIRLKSEFNPSFFQFQLSSFKGQKKVFQNAVGSGREGLNFESIKQFKFAFPSKSEQQKIADFLTTVDERIQQLTKKKQLLEQYKKGVMQQLFSQQLRFKDENGNNYPDWEEKKLGQIGSIISGLTYSPNDINENGVLVLRSSNVQNRSLYFEDNVFVNTDNYNPVDEGDILICVRNGSKNLIGKNAIITKEYKGLAFGAFMSVYRSPYNNFLFHWFGTEEYFKEVRKNLGATINSINSSDLKKFIVPFPSLPEQKQIAEFLSSIDIKIEHAQKQIDKTQAFKKGLLQQMFV